MRRSTRILLIMVVATSLLARGQDPPAPPATGPVSVLLYGAKGNGTTDDAPAIQRALDENPGRTIVLPKRTIPAQFNIPSGPDYYCSRTLVMKGFGQALQGDSPGVVVQFAKGYPGVLLDGQKGNSFVVRDLVLRGSEPWWSIRASEVAPVAPDTDLTVAYASPLPAGPSAADGIQCNSSLCRVVNVRVEHFGRHGLYVTSNLVKDCGADFCSFADVFCVNNRGVGIVTRGGDSQANVFTRCIGMLNQIGGIREASFLGNTYIGCATHTNHFDGSGDGSIAARWKELGMTEGFSYLATESPVASVWVEPYGEADQPPARFGPLQVVTGGCYVPDPEYTPLKLEPSLARLSRPGSVPLSTNWPHDSDAISAYLSGQTRLQDHLRAFMDFDLAIQWQERVGPQGWRVYRGNGQDQKYRLYMMNDGRTHLASEGVESVKLNVEKGSGTGGVQFGDGNGHVVAEVTAAGVFKGQGGGQGSPGKDGKDGQDGDPGPQGPPGDAASPLIRVRNVTATIPRGTRSVTIQHGMGGTPDYVMPMAGTVPVWLTGASNTVLTFTAGATAPTAGITFTWSASRQP